MASDTVPRSMAIATDPAAGDLSVLVDDVTVEVSSGPETRRVPDVTGQAGDQATANLNTAGFQIVLRGPIDSALPAGEVVATDPPAGMNLSVKSAVMVKVSRGNQFAMPNLVGLTYLKVVPLLRGLGHVGALLNGGDVPGTEADRNRVVRSQVA